MIIGGQFTAAGYPTRVVDPATIGVYDANGALRHGCRRLALAQAIASGDPGSRLSAAITDGGLGTGLSFPLTGGWTSTDFAGAHPYLVFPYTDLWNRAQVANGYMLVPPRLFVMVRGSAPANADEVVIHACIVNETDLTTSTIDGRGCGINWTGSQTVQRAVSIADGTCATLNANATGIITADCRMNIRDKNGASSLFFSWVRSWSDTFVTAVAESGSLTATAFPQSPLYIAVTAGRSSAGAAGQKTVSFDVFYIPPVLTDHWPT